MKLLRKFKRDESPLKIPFTIGRGITIGDGGVWAWVEIPARSTDEEDDDTIVGLTLTASAELSKIIPEGAQFHAKVMWRRASGDDYLAAMDRPDLTDDQREYLSMGAKRIDDLAFPERLVLLGVRVDRQAPGFESRTAKLRRTTGTNSCAEASRLDSLTISAVRAFHERMGRSSFRGLAATPQQLAWAIRRDLHRTVDWLPKGGLIGAGQMARLRATQVTPAMDHVKLVTPSGIRYLRMVTTAQNGFPTDSLECPGGEWLKQLDLTGSEYDDDAPTPVEVSIRGRNVPPNEGGKRIQDALLLTKEQGRAAAQGSAEEAPGDVADARAALEARKKSAESMVEDGVTWVVEADDLETLDRRTQALIDYYASPRLDISLWAPPGDQDLLWKQLVIGDSRRVEEFDSFRPMTTLAGAWFHGGSVVGARRGLFLAQNIGSTPGPYFDRLSDAQMEGGAVTNLLVGATGGGKTTALGLSVISEAVMGSFTLMTDFKGDAGGVAKVCKMFGIPVTRLSTAEFSSGLLDPYRYVADVAEAQSMAIDFLSLMLSVKEDPAAAALITRAAMKVANLPPEQRSTHQIIVNLLEDKSEAAADLGERLVLLALDPLARAVAGVPDFGGFQLPARAGFVYVAFEGLRWPEEDTPRDQWAQGERLTMMLVGAAFLYITYQAGRVKGIPKVIALTELHQLTRYPQGRALVGNLARQGRALDVNLLLDTQAVAELLKVEGLVDQVSTVHAFRVNSNAEADAQADLLGLPRSARLRLRQKSHPIEEKNYRQCLTRDRWGRVAVIAFDCLCAEIREALSTRPERDAGQAAPPEFVGEEDTDEEDESA